MVRWPCCVGCVYERYADSTGNLEIGGLSTAPDLTKLSRAELVEYLNVIAALIKKTDLIVHRYQFFDLECQALSMVLKTRTRCSEQSRRDTLSNQTL